MQVHTPEMADLKKFRERSNLFWDRAQSMHRELEQLRRETQRDNCPCRRSSCPFRHTRSKSPPAETATSDEIIERYLASYSPPPSYTAAQNRKGAVARSRTPSLLSMNSASDFEVIDEEEEYYGNEAKSVFRRSSPLRKGKRRHTSLTVTQSVPGDACLCPPSPPIQTPSVRSLSLPQTFNLELASFGSFNEPLEQFQMAQRPRSRVAASA